MGTDIHLYVEKYDGVWFAVEPPIAEETGAWDWEDVQAKWRRWHREENIALGCPEDDGVVPWFCPRDYELFWCLAGVRGRFDRPRGPNARGLPPDVSAKVAAEANAIAPDAHTHSWLTLAELNAMDLPEWFSSDVMSRIRAVVDGDDPNEVRVVFWFDN